MEELRELKTRMESQRPAEWEALPDLNLYMDQVIGYMPRQLIQYGEGERLTSAMVNNYIKDGLLPRAEEAIRKEPSGQPHCDLCAEAGAAGAGCGAVGRQEQRWGAPGRL